MFQKKNLYYIFNFLFLVSISPDSWGKTPSLDPSKNFEYKHWLGEDYSENALLQEKWATRFFFDRYQFKGNEKILDIGCGDGRITSKIAGKVPEGLVIGIDQSLTMINEGSTKYSFRKNILFIQELAQNISFYEKYDGVFDVVTSFTALHWVKEQEDVLKGVYKVLKPFGKLYFRLCSDGDDPIYEIATELSRQSDYKSDFKSFVDPLYRFSVTEYKKLLHDAGFKVISVEDVEDRDEIKNLEDFKKQVKSYLPHYHFLRANFSEKKANKFVEEIILEYEKRVPKFKNKTILIDHYLEIIAQK